MIAARRRLTAVTTAALILGACSRPLFIGPQIQRVVEGFFYDANSTQGRNVFPQGDMVRQGAWWSSIDDDDEYSSIFITTYRGNATREDVQAARDYQEERFNAGGAGDAYGGLELLTIDGRPAWGWLETSRARGEVSAYEYKAVVSYDSLTFAIEFYTREPRWMHPDTLRAVVAAFGIGRTRWNLPGLGLAILTTVVLGGLLLDRFKRMEVRSARVSEMRLAVLPEPEKGEDQPDADEYVPPIATDGVTPAEQSPAPDPDAPRSGAE